MILIVKSLVPFLPYVRNMDGCGRVSFFFLIIYIKLREKNKIIRGTSV